MKTILISLLAFLFSNNPEQIILPDDFAIRLNDGTDTVDTFYNMYSRKDVFRMHKANTSVESADSTIDFKFSTSEELIIYKELLKINYSTFPKEIKVKCQAVMDPSSLIIMIIRANGKEKMISFDDGCISPAKKVKDFQHLVALVYSMAKHHEGVRKMPASMSLKL